MAGEFSQPAERALRADAQRNRDRIVDAARRLFSARGIDVPIEDIADLAGVGVATLYRRFPTRDALVSAVFEATLLAYATAAEEAAAARDPWEGFATYVQRVCAMQAADRGFTDVSTMVLPASDVLEHLRVRAQRATRALVRRAQDAGVLRDDFVPEDLLLVLMANAGVVRVTRDAAPHAWRRLLAYVLEGCRPDHTNPLPAAPTPAQTRRSMLGFATARGMHPSAVPRPEPERAEHATPVR